MANEIRLRSNNISGTITDNPLTIGATTINSPGFVDLPTVGTTNHLILILDPLEVNGQAEIVQVTAHAASSSVCTIVRGFETTTPRQHGFGTTWFHGPVVSDYNYTQRTALSTNRPTAPFTGETIYETDTARWTGWNGSSWVPATHNVPACRVFQTGAQTVPDGTLTNLTFDSERYDTDSMHSTVSNTSRITFNTAGIYLVTGHIAFVGFDYNSLYIAVMLNGTTLIAANINNDFTDAAMNVYAASISTAYKFAVNDFVELRIWQNNTVNAARSTVAGNYSPEFSATWIGVG